MDINSLLSLSKNSSTVITVEATVCSGFEQEALLECTDKLGKELDICKSRGRICFNTFIDKFSLVKQLRGVDNLLIVVNQFTVEVSEDPLNKEHDLNVIKQLVNEIEWKKYVTIWADVLSYKGIIFPSREQYVTAINKQCVKTKKSKDAGHAKSEQLSDGCSASYGLLVSGDQNDFTADNQKDMLKSKEDEKLLKYRVTCYRSGKHSFSSQEAAYCFGGLLQDRYNWIVNLDDYDLEIILKIAEKTVTVLIAVTESSLHRRNITHFGLTTLRATMSYNMLKLANTSFGDVVMDPLCGSGSIPIEGALSFPGTVHICGDIHKKAVNLTKLNVKCLNEKLKNATFWIDIFKWDAVSLPLKNESVDVVVTDLPFGKRVGSKSKNKVLYFDVLKELSRVVKPTTGRAVFLTTNRNTFTMVLRKNNSFWEQKKMLVINMGGLRGFVYLLMRTAKKV